MRSIFEPLHTPSIHGIDRLRKFRGAGFVDTTHIDPYVFESILFGLLASVGDLHVARLLLPSWIIDVLKSDLPDAPAMGENGITWDLGVVKLLQLHVVDIDKTHPESWRHSVTVVCACC
jgi:hypothetical protein